MYVDTEEKRGKYDFVTVKVRPETYRKLRMYQAHMVLQSGGAKRYTMDEVINALLTLVEAVFSTGEDEEEEEEEV